MHYEIWTFKTARFTVKVTAEEESSPDLSWDDTGEVAEKLASGALEIFCAKAAVYLDGHEIGTDYLGNCIYAQFNEFRDHVGIGKQAYLEKARIEVCDVFEWHRAKLARYHQSYAKGNISTAFYRRSCEHSRTELTKARQAYAQKKACA